MTYRELLEYAKSNPGCLQSENQKKKVSDYEYYQWVVQQNKNKSTNAGNKEAF